MHRAVLSIGLLLAGAGAIAGEMDVQPQPMTEWKSVYGEVQTRDVVPARTRIGGTLVSLDVTEGDRVEAGQQVAVVEDDKLALQIDAMEAQLESLKAQLATAQSDLERGEALGERGVITSQRLDELRTAVEVLQGQISATEAQQNVISRQVEEGAVLAPEAGIVLSVPVSRGSVVTAGETVAVVGGGGVFLRLQIPERHADALAEGDVIEIETADGPREGRLAKIYPQIEGGRVAADVEVDGLDRRFVGDGCRCACRWASGRRSWCPRRRCTARAAWTS